MNLDGVLSHVVLDHFFRIVTCAFCGGVSERGIVLSTGREVRLDVEGSGMDLKWAEEPFLPLCTTWMP